MFHFHNEREFEYLMTISTGYFYQDSNYALYNIYYERTESGDDDVTRVGEDGETGLNSWVWLDSAARACGARRHMAVTRPRCIKSVVRICGQN